MDGIVIIQGLKKRLPVESHDEAVVDDRSLKHDRARPLFDLGQRSCPGNRELLVVVPSHLDRALTLDRYPNHEAVAAGSNHDCNHLDFRADCQPRLERQVGHHIVRCQIAAIVGIVVADRPVLTEHGIPVAVDQPVQPVIRLTAQMLDRIVHELAPGLAPAAGKPAPWCAAAGKSIEETGQNPAEHSGYHAPGSASRSSSRLFRATLPSITTFPPRICTDSPGSAHDTLHVGLDGSPGKWKTATSHRRGGRKS